MASTRLGWTKGISTSRFAPLFAVWLVGAVVATMADPVPASAQSLRGSRSSVDRQHRIACDHDFTFLRNASHVRKFVDLGLLVRVTGNRYYELSGVSYPYARHATKTFIERLAMQYYQSTGEKLVVTSLTRPLSRQPHNASDKSVHPAGMAIDLRIPRNPSARRWLESTLLSIEANGVIDATKERYPPHFHVAVFPNPYLGYVELLERNARQEDYTHRVASGDTLWSIARQYNTTVSRLLQVNGLGDSSIFPGQALTIPGG